MRRSGNKLPVPFLADSDCLAWMSGPLTTILVVTDYDDLDMFGGLDASSLPLRQQQILMTIRDLVAANGCTPSTRQIGDAVGLRSTSTVSKHLKSLEEKGFLRRGAAMARQLDVRAVPRRREGTVVVEYGDGSGRR